ncbi:MAG: LysM peptidoglycan-binding domain-containing protein [Bdellovibrionota bacterium]
MATSTRRFPEGEKFYYPVVAGDTLARLIEAYYPFNGPAERGQILRQLLADNPDIVSPNLIYPGQLIHFRTPFEPNALEQSEVSELGAAKRSGRR